MLFLYSITDLLVFGLYNLPIDQKIEIVTKLWDNIVDSDAPITLSPEVIAEVDRRLAEFNADPSVGIDREEMWRRVGEGRSKQDPPNE